MWDNRDPSEEAASSWARNRRLRERGDNIGRQVGEGRSGKTEKAGMDGKEHNPGSQQLGWFHSLLRDSKASRSCMGVLTQL